MSYKVSIVVAAVNKMYVRTPLNEHVRFARSAVPTSIQTIA